MKWHHTIRIGLLVSVLSVTAACAAPSASVQPTAVPTTVAAAVATAIQPAAATVPAATEAATAAPAEATPAAVATQPTVAPAAANTKLNLNSASGDDYLAAIPSFSNRMVREFLEYRPYASILQFRQEIGKYVDDAQVAEYEKYVYVPVDVNQSDAATLMQIPGIDQALAATLIAARPYASNDAFLAKLGESLSAAQAAVAATYLAAQ